MDRDVLALVPEAIPAQRPVPVTEPACAGAFRALHSPPFRLYFASGCRWR